VPTLEELRTRGEIGGRTVVVEVDGRVACRSLAPAPLPADHVRVRTVRTALSPGTEMTFVGAGATNVHLVRRWNEELRLFEAGATTASLPMAFGYRAAGEVVESQNDTVPVGTRVWGNWRHTELVSMPVVQADDQRVPDEIGWDDALDIGQMGPIGVNAAAFGEEVARDRPAVVFGAGPIGLITAQAVRAVGAGDVTVVDRLVSRLAVAEGLGFGTLVVEPGADVAAALKRRHGADGIPAAWECSGSVAALAEAIRCVARRGTVVAVGFYQGGADALRLGDEFHHNGVGIVTAQIGNPAGTLTRRDLQRRTLELVVAEKLVLGGLPRIVLPVEHAAAAFEALRRPDDVLQVALDYA
jgi:D-arabinose 1-dehydrogenase-like Zn-dependent alcohol dehydrogenase